MPLDQSHPDLASNVGPLQGAYSKFLHFFHTQKFACNFLAAETAELNLGVKYLLWVCAKQYKNFDLSLKTASARGHFVKFMGIFIKILKMAVS